MPLTDITQRLLAVVRERDAQVILALEKAALANERLRSTLRR
jgi:hypothetical protein